MNSYPDEHYYQNTRDMKKYLFVLLSCVIVAGCTKTPAEKQEKEDPFKNTEWINIGTSEEDQYIPVLSFDEGENFKILSFSGSILFSSSYLMNVGDTSKCFFAMSLDAYSLKEDKSIFLEKAVISGDELNLTYRYYYMLKPLLCHTITSTFRRK